MTIHTIPVAEETENRRNGISAPYPLSREFDKETARLLLAQTITETVGTTTQVVAESITRAMGYRGLFQLLAKGCKPLVALVFACGIAGAGFAFVVVGLLRLLPQ